MRRSAVQTREHVLQIAHDLFYWHGIRAVGVDRIAAEAGVAPTTLYRLFASKDDLITAYVERAGSLYRDWFNAVTADDSRGPSQRILALFDALAEQVRPGQCRGCPFLMALAEIPDPHHPAHQHAAGTKGWVRARLGELAEATGAADPSSLADHLTLAMEGVYASVQALGDQGPARRARSLAELLLASATSANE
ncbi:TetR/AcrR family transcriptional regulator [Nonomuraea jiangxiensis]|uniref:DNA-binding transcriptional regulator, AcrR family n=1 Tax=Nonomuraea jiangxiensis TaxID=633440 RepID=A0A1G9Q5U9_9ACTN|nr:TetR family transcriptional regulator [Nonomuraea jiangxiensis]SDM06388.1 DNA-binding transcriptional regulator, AcrR family [Nonomuraea jiangxiensis]